MLRASNRRRSTRHRVHGPVDFRIENWHLRRGLILNLCLEGFLLEPQQATDCVPGDRLDVRFEVNHTSFRARVEVRHLNPSGRLGVEIVEVSLRSRERLLELLAEMTEASEPSL